MRIAQLAPLWKTVPPEQYGGTELVVSNLTEELLRQGMDVTLFACGGSQTSAKLVKVIQKPMYDLVGGFSWHTIQPYMLLSFAELFERLDKFDIIHSHIDDFSPLVFSSLINMPILTTWHSSTAPIFPFLAKRFKHNSFISISNAQRGLAPYLNFVQTIYHGIETKKFTFSAKTDNDYLLFLGSLTPEKGIDIAVKAARELGEKIIIAGETRPGYDTFLQKNVLRYVDGRQIQMLGEVNFKQKCQLYAGAKALLFPIQWNEAFGLVMVEALASGTPVIAYNNGSVPEIIEDGKTGFVVKDYNEFIQAIKSIKSISRATCRDVAVGQFDVSKMAENYINLYRKLTQKKL